MSPVGAARGAAPVPGDDSGQFFPPLPPAGECPAPPRYVGQPWMRVPIEHVPTVLPHSTLIGVTDDGFAVVFAGIEVFPTGIAFALRATPGPSAEPTRPTELYRDMAGYAASRIDQRLRIGLLYDDGRTATNLFIHGPYGDQPPRACLVITGGQGGDGHAGSSHWAWPIPDRGDLTIVISWESRGIPERRIVLSGDDLRAAATRSQSRELWPGAKLPPPSPSID